MEISQKSIATIIKDKNLIELLNNIGINTLEELCSYSPKRLTEKGLASLYVKDIAIALQCEGLDLSKK